MSSLDSLMRSMTPNRRLCGLEDAIPVVGRCSDCDSNEESVPAVRKRLWLEWEWEEYMGPVGGGGSA